MEFGRVLDPSLVDFALPASHPSTATRLGGKAVPDAPIYVGCPVWHDKGWNGVLFPKGTKDIQHLYYYAKKFNSIELNSTHYQVPSEETVLRWKRDTPSDFRFFPKVPQAISHLDSLLFGKDPLRAFIARMQLLEDKLGTFFLQLPPTITVLKRSELEHLLAAVPPEVSLSVELRSEDWFKNERALDEFGQFLCDRKLGLVITDVSGRRDVLHQRITNKKAFIRFTANNLHPTDFTRLDAWVKLVQEWRSQGLEELQFFMHTPDKSLCLELAAYFLEKMNLPYQHLDRGPVQGSLF